MRVSCPECGGEGGFDILDEISGDWFDPCVECAGMGLVDEDDDGDAGCPYCGDATGSCECQEPASMDEL